VHGVVDDNHNSHRNMIMDIMRMNQGMNQGYADKFSIVDEKSNTNATMFFFFYKRF
jgi:D-aminopeptidase